MQFFSIYDLIFDKAKNKNMTTEEVYSFFRTRKIKKADILDLSQTSYIPTDEKILKAITEFLEMSELEMSIAMGRIPSEYRQSYLVKLKKYQLCLK